MQRESVPLLRLSRMAAGFLKPTPYGTFGSALGNAATGLAEGLQDESDMKLREQGAEQQAALFAMRKQQMDQQQAAAQEEKARNDGIAGVFDSFLPPPDPMSGMSPVDQAREAARGGAPIDQSTLDRAFDDKQMQTRQDLGLANQNSPLMQNQPGQNRPTQEHLKSAQLKLMKYRARDLAKDLGALYAKPERNLKEINGQIVDMDTQEILAEIPKQISMADKLRQANSPFNADGSPNPDYQQFKQADSRAGATNVDARNIEARRQSKYEELDDKNFVDMHQSIRANAMEAPVKIAQYKRVTDLLEGIEGGGLAPSALALSSAVKSLGINLDPNLGNKEAAEALTIELALGMKPEGSGTMSDMDFAAFLKGVPSLSKSEPGRKAIMETVTAKLERDIKLNEMAAEYRKTNGRLDDGFVIQASKFMQDNPVVAKVGEVSGKIGAAQEEFEGFSIRRID